MSVPALLRLHRSVTGSLLVALAILGPSLLARALGGSAVQEVIQLVLLHPVYSVPQLWNGLGRDPEAWVGRTVLLRGQIVGERRFSDTLDRMVIIGPPSLAPAAPLPSGRSLPLEVGPADTVLARLRWLPFLAGVLPRPQVLDWDRPGIYRIEVQEMPCSAQHGRACYRGLVLDAMRWQE